MAPEPPFECVPLLPGRVFGWALMKTIIAMLPTCVGFIARVEVFLFRPMRVVSRTWVRRWIDWIRWLRTTVVFPSRNRRAVVTIACHDYPPMRARARRFRAESATHKRRARGGRDGGRTEPCHATSVS